MASTFFSTLLSTISTISTIRAKDKQVLPIPRGIGNRVVGRVTKGKYSDKDFEKDVILVTGGDVIEGYETLEL
jgi:hypothetical protein